MTRQSARHARLQDEFETRGGYVAEAEAKKVAANLGIGTAELEQPVATMSGGQRRRVELARILFAETETLLLDEPTNHLDLDAKAWLVDYLSGYCGGFSLISHDLPLLDTAITTILELEGAVGRRHPWGVPADIDGQDGAADRPHGSRVRPSCCPVRQRHRTPTCPRDLGQTRWPPFTRLTTSPRSGSARPGRK